MRSTFSSSLVVADVVEGDALVSVLLSVPDQQLLPDSQRPTAAKQDPSTVLKRYQVLLFLSTGTVHIPGERGRRDRLMKIW